MTPEQLLEATRDAYSFRRYGELNWLDACRELLAMGCDAREAEAVLRSKWMRWAADLREADDTEPQPTFNDLGRWMDATYGSVKESRKAIGALAKEHWGE